MSLASVLERLTGKLDKLQAIAGGKGVTTAEGLQGLNWTTQIQHQMHQAIGADATREIKAGAGFAGAGLGLLNNLTGGQGVSGVADKAIKSSPMEGLKSVGGAASDVGGKLMATGNPYAVAAGAVMKFSGAIAEIPSQIKEWGDHLHEQNRQFSQYSGSMAAVMATDDARRVQLERLMGDERAASARDLADARFRLDKSMAPIENAFANLKNNVVAKLTDVLTGFADGLKKLFPKLFKDDASESDNYLKFEETAKVMEAEIKARRPRHMR